MLFSRTAIVICFLSSIFNINALVTIPFSLSSAFHLQELPLRKMHALCMEIWGTIDAGINDLTSLQTFYENHPYLLSRVMTMQSMFDILVVQLSKIMNENPEQYDHTLNEIEHMHNVLQDAHKAYQPIISSKHTYTYAITHSLELILQKIEFLLHTRLALSPYYAFSRTVGYPKAITPSSVPTNILPVAPII